MSKQTSVANKVVAVFLSMILITAFYLSTHRVPSPPLEPAVALDPREVLITVSGHGSVPNTIEQLHLVLGVHQGARTAVEADHAMNKVMDKLLTSLNEAGVPRNNINKTNQQLQPQWPSGPSTRGLTPQGYIATTTIEINGLEPNQKEAIMDIALANGVTQVIKTETYRLADQNAKKQALKMALDDAKERAKQIASLMGRELGEILAIDESGTGFGLTRMSRVPEGGASHMTDRNSIQDSSRFNKEASTSVRVLVVYRLKF